jgi:glycosyltransferase involved in cell wall biosynthesis
MKKEEREKARRRESGRVPSQVDAGSRFFTFSPAPLGVSVIVCTYNGKDRILYTIEHLQNQNIGNVLRWEVIVVDNASTDDTGDFVTAAWMNKNITDFKVIRENKPGVMHARIKGIMEAKYEYACFIDDDNLPDKNWVADVLQTFNTHPEIAGCGGKTIPVFESTSPDWFPIASHTYACGDQLEGGSGYIETLWGAGLCVRKSAWNYLLECGFKNHLTDRTGSNLLAGGDSEICLGLRMAGFKLWYNNDLKLQHFIPNGKLDFNKMLKMVEGFGKAEVVLRIYRSMLDHSVEIYPGWLSEYVATVWYYLKLLIKYKIIRTKHSLLDTQYYFFVKGYLNYLFHLKTDYRLIQKEIHALYKNLKIGL